MNIHKIQTVAKKALAAALPLALCFSIAGCSLKFKLFDNSDFKPTSESEALLSEIPEPKQTSYSYSAITNEHIKNLYAQIENECQKPVPAEIQCTGTLTQKDIYEAIIAFKNDHPDIFWIKNTFSYYDYDGSTYVELFYISSGTTLETQKEKFNEALNDFVNNATMYSSEYEREKYVNDYIISNCVYDDEAAYNNKTQGNVSTAYGVLVDGKAICEGYARAFQLLCNKLGIECVSIAGMTGNVGHEWNCAKIDGNWYQVDVTWNDSQDDFSNYYYFNLTDEQMYSSHRADDLFDEIEPDNYNNDENLIGNLYVPECNSTEYNYYNQTAPVLYAFDEENDNTISNALANSAVNGDNYFNIIVDDSLDFEDAYSTLVQDGYVVNYIESANNMLWGEVELDTSSYAYKNDTLRVITIVLNYIN